MKRVCGKRYEYIAVYCSVLQCVAVWCSVLQRVVVRILDTVVQYELWHEEDVWQTVLMCCSVLQCVAVCCGVLRGVAGCCGVLQCAAAWGKLYFRHNCAL